MARHLADRPRVVPIIGEPRVGSVPIGQQRCPGLHVGPHEGFEGCRGIVRNGGEAIPPASVQVFCPFAPGLGLVGPTVDHLDRAGDQDFSRFQRIEEAVVGPEWISA